MTSLGPRFAIHCACACGAFTFVVGVARVERFAAWQSAVFGAACFVMCTAGVVDRRCDAEEGLRLRRAVSGVFSLESPF